MQSHSRQFYLLSLVLCTALFAGEKGPTSFIDGTWKLNAAKSDGGPRGLPDNLSIKVTTKGPEFEGLQNVDRAEVLLKFRSDGKETVNPLPNDVEMRAKHRVENGAVLAEYRIIIPGQGEFTQIDRITVSADGKVLTNEREVKTGQGNFKQKMIFDRQ